MTRCLLLVLALVALPGCCTAWLANKCCPPTPPPKLVEVQVPCKLPDVPKLDDVLPADKDCPLPYVCFDPVNAKLLAERERKMKLWIREVRATCTSTPAAPASTSQSTSQP